MRYHHLRKTLRREHRTLNMDMRIDKAGHTKWQPICQVIPYPFYVLYLLSERYLCCEHITFHDIDIVYFYSVYHVRNYNL